MIPAWFQRMNPRERVLALVVGGLIFLLLNVFIWNSLLGALHHARTELAARHSLRAQQNVYLREKKMWARRADWLKKHQPVMKSPVEASTLLDQVKQAALKHNVQIENPAIGSSDSTPNYQAVFASVETKSAWPPLVHFLYDVQQPESFVVFENVNLAIDSSDPTVMRGKFKIARWFAPKK
ncbi:MAG: type II secretion system protein M [Verrucomicrobiota bacterium]|nr:type II secretion system protein M [Verrucomicrobiota bacterium]